MNAGILPQNDAPARVSPTQSPQLRARAVSPIAASRTAFRSVPDRALVSRRHSAGLPPPVSGCLLAEQRENRPHSWDARRMAAAAGLRACTLPHPSTSVATLDRPCWSSPPPKNALRPAGAAHDGACRYAGSVRTSVRFDAASAGTSRPPRWRHNLSPDQRTRRWATAGSQRTHDVAGPTGSAASWPRGRSGAVVQRGTGGEIGTGSEFRRSRAHGDGQPARAGRGSASPPAGAWREPAPAPQPHPSPAPAIAPSTAATSRTRHAGRPRATGATRPSRSRRWRERRPAALRSIRIAASRRGRRRDGVGRHVRHPYSVSFSRSRAGVPGRRAPPRSPAPRQRQSPKRSLDLPELACRRAALGPVCATHRGSADTCTRYRVQIGTMGRVRSGRGNERHQEDRVHPPATSPPWFAIG